MPSKSGIGAGLVLSLMGAAVSGLGLLASTPGENAARQDAGKRQEPKKSDLPIGLAGKARTDACGDLLPQGAVARLGTIRFRHGFGVSLVAFSADGSKLVFAGSGDVDNAIRIVEANTGKELRTLRLKPSEMPGAMSLSANGKILAVAWSNPNTYQGAIVIWDIATGKEIQRIDCGGPPGGLAFSPNGKLLITVDFARRMHAWEVRTGKKVHDFTDIAGRVGQPTFFPDGKVLAFTTFLDKRRQQTMGFLYDLTTWRPVQSMPARLLAMKDLPETLAFSPDGKTLVGGDLLGLISFRKAKTGELLERAKVTTQLTATPILSMSFSHDSKCLSDKCLFMLQ